MTLIFVALGFLPSFAWLIFFRKEDIHPEPKKMIAKVFIYGALVTLAALIAQYGIRDALNFLNISEFVFIGFFLFAAAEEILKFFAAWKTVGKSKYFDEPADAMIYMITAALGFALVENLAVALGSGDAREAVASITLRFVGATLLHVLSSAIAGYYWAKALAIRRRSFDIVEGDSIYDRQSPNRRIILEGLAIASLLHAIFNYLILNLKDVVVYPIIFLVVVAMFVFWDFEQLKT